MMFEKTTEASTGVVPLNAVIKKTSQYSQENIKIETLTKVFSVTLWSRINQGRRS